MEREISYDAKSIKYLVLSDDLNASSLSSRQRWRASRTLDHGIIDLLHLDEIVQVVEVPVGGEQPVLLKGSADALYPATRGAHHCKHTLHKPGAATRRSSKEKNRRQRNFIKVKYRKNNIISNEEQNNKM